MIPFFLKGGIVLNISENQFLELIKGIKFPEKEENFLRGYFGLLVNGEVEMHTICLKWTKWLALSKLPPERIVNLANTQTTF